MKKTLIIPIIALVFAFAAAPLAFANDNRNDRNDDKENYGYVDSSIRAGFFARYFHDDNWMCNHPGWGRFFAKGWLKNHECPKPGDTTSPNIRSIDVTVKDTSATVKITSNEAIAATLAYESNNSYGKRVTEMDYKNDQKLVISGLSPNTQYHFMVTIRDRAGNTASSIDRVFTTQARDNSNNDNGSAEISNIRVVNVTSNRAEISWTTDERATGRIYYTSGGILNIGTFRIVSDGTMRTEHSMALSNLSNDTRYLFIIESTDADGNISVSSQSSFTTE